MSRKFLFLFLMLAQSIAHGDELFSGPQKGEKTPPFKVLDLSGPNSGKEIDYVGEWKGAPTLICFIHTLTRPGAQLMRRLDDHGDRNKSTLKTLFVSLTADLQATERQLPHSIKALSLKCPAAISLDGAEGPGAYGLNKEVLLTVIAARDNVVVGNWAIVSPNETDFPKIQPVLDKLTEPSLETPEAMRAEVLRLRSELAALRAEVEELKRSGANRPAGRGEMEKKSPEKKAADSADPKKELPGKAPTDARLVELLRKLIRVEAAQADIDAAIVEIQAYVKDNADLKKQYVESIKLVDHLGYGTDYSKTTRRKLADDLSR